VDVGNLQAVCCLQTSRGERQPKKSIPHTGDDLDLARVVKGNRITACLCLSAFYRPLTKAFTGTIPSYFVPAYFFSLLRLHNLHFS